jgi:branched-chain amino acid transport system ATP-binding protein
MLLARFKLEHMRDEFAGSLSGGQRKLLEMARALMADPKLIMLDEPMAGVNPALKQSLLDHILVLKDEGRTVLFVEHDMDMVHEISDWVLVMAEGRLVAEGTATQISGDQAVIDAYLGAHHDIDLGAVDESTAMSELGLDEEELGVGTLHQIAEEHESSDWTGEAGS